LEILQWFLSPKINDGYGSQADILLDITSTAASECKATIHKLILDGTIAISRFVTASVRFHQ